VHGHCRYIYCGQTVLCVDNVLSLFVLADKYNVVDLKCSCVQYMQHHLVAACDKCQAVLWYEYSQACSVVELQQACLNYIVLNMDTVMQSDCWQCLNHDNLVALLRRSDLIVNSEYVVLQVQFLIICCKKCRLFIVLYKIARSTCSIQVLSESS